METQVAGVGSRPGHDIEEGVGHVGGGLREVAWADDGTIEGLEDPERRFAVGVLWHPEAGEDARLFDGLVAEARAYRADRRG